MTGTPSAPEYLDLRCQHRSWPPCFIQAGIHRETTQRAAAILPALPTQTEGKTRLTACRPCTTGSRRRGRRRLRTAGCPSAPPAPRCSWRPRCTAGLRGKDGGLGSVPGSPGPPNPSPCSSSSLFFPHVQEGLKIISEPVSSSRRCPPGGFGLMEDPTLQPSVGSSEYWKPPPGFGNRMCPCTSPKQLEGVAREELRRVFPSTSEHKWCCVLPCSLSFSLGFFLKEKAPVYCSLLSSPRRLSAQHLTMGGKPKLRETAEEEVVEKNGARKDGEKRAKHHLLRKTAATCPGSRA